MRRVPSCAVCVRFGFVLLLGSGNCLPAHAQEEAHQTPTPCLSPSDSTWSAATTTGVAVNEGLLVTGSIRATNGAIPDLCVELRGYEAINALGEEYEYQGVDHIATGPPVVHRGHAWWSRSDQAQPRFVHMQRTTSPGGEFAFVTPESGVVLALAVYAHGGDYPSAIRMFLRPNGRHASPTREATTHDVYLSESGRMDINISLDVERMEAPELLWSSSARENDDSPCARKHTAGGAAENPNTLHQQNMIPSLMVRTSYNQHTEAAQRPSFLQNPKDEQQFLPMATCDSHMPSVTPSACMEEHSNYLISAVKNTALAMLHFQSLCWNYGQHKAAFWEDNPAVCPLLRSASEASSANIDTVMFASNPIGMSWDRMRWRHLASSTDVWPGFLVLVGFGTFVICFVLPRRRTSAHTSAVDHEDHVCLPATANRSFEKNLSTLPPSGDLTNNIVHTMVGTVYSSDGRLSQIALESTHRHAQEVPRQSPRTRRWLNGRDARQHVKKYQEDDAFSSMFRALGDATLRNVQQEGGDNSSSTNCMGNVVVSQKGQFT